MIRDSVHRLLRRRGIVVRALFSILLSAAAVVPAAAQEETRDLTQIPIEELANLEVYSASKFLQKASDAPSSISIITADEIQRHGYRTFADVLRNVTGLYVTYDRNYSYIGARGFGRPGDYNSRILILIDGHRLNDNVDDGTDIGTDFPLDVDIIDRVEVVRGPGSSLYGTSAFFAVVNVITKRGRVFEGGEFAAAAASRGSYRGRLSVGERLRSGLEMLLSGSYYDSKGYRRLYYPEFDAPETNNGIAQNADTDRAGSFFANVSYREVNFQAVFNSREKAIPTASFGTYFNDRRTRTKDERGYFDVKFEHAFKNGWDLLSRAYFDRYDYNGTYIYDNSETLEPQLVSNEDWQQGMWWGGEVQMSRPLGTRHHLTIGTEFRRNFRQDQGNYDASPDYFLYSNDHRHSSNSALFIQDEYSLSKHLILNGGIRYDRYSTFGGTTNPRLGLIYSPWEKTTVKALYGHAFRAPAAYELYYYGAGNKPNPYLRPETIHTTELVVERFLGPKFRIAGSAYYYRLDHLISQQTDPVDTWLIYSNTDEIRARGLEFEVEARGLYGIDGRLGYALQRATNQATSLRLSNSPEHLAHLNLAIPLFRGSTWAGTTLSYMSSRKTVTGGHTGGFFLADMTLLNRKLFRHAELSAGVYNLFDKRYADPGSEEHLQETILQDGRSFRVTLTYRLPLKRAESYANNHGQKP
ncbi:MAG TPA: TonB-dependent receptor [Acidobacteriota bacterium]|nr:TonB-dependent receptor [Acidobacteriota bacterium]